METLCSTRAIKVLKHLRSVIPETVPPSSVDAIETLPISVFANLHGTLASDRAAEYPQLKTWLANNQIPSANVTVSGPLFHGTLVFVQLIFQEPNQPSSSVKLADVQTARNYAALAVGPIQRYASQYGPSNVGVSPTVISFTANVSGNSFTQSQFEGWVDQCAKTARDNHVSNPCIVILHNRDLPNTPQFKNERNSFHSITGNGTPYCYCLVFGESLSVADNNHTINGKPNEKVYAHMLSHEIAEMVVDPNPNVHNPEVCDGCAGNCNNDQFDLFDANGTFIGGTNQTSTATGFAFFINSIIRPEAIDPNNPNECALAGSDLKAVCIYPPPIAWNGQGDLTTVTNIVSLAGHFSTGDQRHLVVVGTAQGKVHEIFWKPAQQGIEGQDDLPVTFPAGSIVSVATMYNSDQQRHVVIVGKKDGKVHEIFWKPDTVGIEGHDDLPVTFTPGSIVAVSALYNSDQQRYVVLVATTAGKVHEIFWKDTTVGVEGHDDLPVPFAPGSIVGVAGFYNSDQQRYVVVVATSAGKLHEIFWKDNTVGVEGHDDLPANFGSGSIRAVSGFYDRAKQRHVVIVATKDGRVHQVYWKATTVGIEANSTVTEFSTGSIVGVAGFYSASDQIDHIVVGLTNGRLRELWTKPDV
jgi:hypothetical protein